MKIIWNKVFRTEKTKKNAKHYLLSMPIALLYLTIAPICYFNFDWGMLLISSFLPFCTTVLCLLIVVHLVRTTSIHPLVTIVAVTVLVLYSWLMFLSPIMYPVLSGTPNIAKYFIITSLIYSIFLFLIGDFLLANRIHATQVQKIHTHKPVKLWHCLIVVLCFSIVSRIIFLAAVDDGIIAKIFTKDAFTSEMRWTWVYINHAGAIAVAGCFAARVASMKKSYAFLAVIIPAVYVASYLALWSVNWSQKKDIYLWNTEYFILAYFVICGIIFPIRIWSQRKKDKLV